MLGRKRRVAEQLWCIYLKGKKVWTGNTKHNYQLAMKPPSSINRHSLPVAHASIMYTHTHVNTNEHTNRLVVSGPLELNTWASCCTCGPGLVFCLFVGEVVCAVVKVKGKHSHSSSDVWTCWECPPPSPQSSWTCCLLQADGGRSFTRAGQTEQDRLLKASIERTWRRIYCAEWPQYICGELRGLINTNNKTLCFSAQTSISVICTQTFSFSANLCYT